MIFVSSDDHLDELVPDNVLVGKVHELDHIDVLKDFLGFLQTALLPTREVDLSLVAGNHRL